MNTSLRRTLAFPSVSCAEHRRIFQEALTPDPNAAKNKAAEDQAALEKAAADKKLAESLNKGKVTVEVDANAQAQAKKVLAATNGVVDGARKEFQQAQNQVKGGVSEKAQVDAQQKQITEIRSLLSTMTIAEMQSLTKMIAAVQPEVAKQIEQSIQALTKQGVPPGQIMEQSFAMMRVAPDGHPETTARLSAILLALQQNRERNAKNTPQALPSNTLNDAREAQLKQEYLAPGGLRERAYKALTSATTNPEQAREMQQYLEDLRGISPGLANFAAKAVIVMGPFMKPFFRQLAGPQQTAPQYGNMQQNRPSDSSIDGRFKTALDRQVGTNTSVEAAQKSVVRVPVNPLSLGLSPSVPIMANQELVKTAQGRVQEELKGLEEPLKLTEEQRKNLSETQQKTLKSLTARQKRLQELQKELQELSTFAAESAFDQASAENEKKTRGLLEQSVKTFNSRPGRMADVTVGDSDAMEGAVSLRLAPVDPITPEQLRNAVAARFSPMILRDETDANGMLTGVRVLGANMEQTQGLLATLLPVVPQDAPAAKAKASADAENAGKAKAAANIDSAG